MRRNLLPRLLGAALLAGCGAVACAQDPVSAPTATVTTRLVQAQLDSAHRPQKSPPAVIWLSPLHSLAQPAMAPGNFTLVQKNKMFTPHLLVVPVGSAVAFPNADPFFHNVFSLFDGRRFDLGLYEAGTTRSVVFSREGISYIFCNIHSEMSAVVIALATPLYGFSDAHGVFHLKDVPDGEYDLHVWIEGHKQSSLDRLTRRVRVTGQVADLGEIRADQADNQPHLNKFGRPYDSEPHPIY